MKNNKFQEHQINKYTQLNKKNNQINYKIKNIVNYMHNLNRKNNQKEGNI